jgi:phospholipid N-methyltransferase
LNSICRKYNKLSLDSLTENLVRGVGERKLVESKEVDLDGAKALDSLYEGVVDGVYLHLRTVVMIKEDCTFDFIHVSVPKREVGNPNTFDDFLASFHTS